MASSSPIDASPVRTASPSGNYIKLNCSFHSGSIYLFFVERNSVLHLRSLFSKAFF